MSFREMTAGRERQKTATRGLSRRKSATGFWERRCAYELRSQLPCKRTNVSGDVVRALTGRSYLRMRLEMLNRARAGQRQSITIA